MADAYSCIAQAVPDHITARYRAQAEAFRAQHGIEPRPWYRITNQTADEAEVMLYDEVGGWFGATADDFIAELRQITAPRMRVRVNSPGGSVFEGIAIANALRAHPANVTVQVDAIAASIASVIAMAGDRIEMAPNSMMMIHDASGLCLGDASDMEEMAELLDLISDNIADAYATRAGGTREQWRERMRAETWYLPEDAVENGLADEALAAPKVGTPSEPEQGEEEPDMARAFDLAAYGYTGPRATGGIVENPPAVGEDSCTLTIPIGAALGEQLVEALRASVKRRGEPVTETPVADPPAPEAASEPAGPTAVTDQPAEPDTWAAAFAHLTEPKPDPWADAFSHLVNPQPSSSAATAAA